MAHYILRRLLAMVPMLLGISILSFAVIRLAPGQPGAVEQSLNPKVSPEVRLKLQKLYGLDKPLAVQYLSWLARMAKGDFGNSFTGDRPVMRMILERLPVTLGINLASFLIILAFGIALGVKSSLVQGSAFDKCVTVASFLGLAAPTFWLALILMQLFCIQWGLLPVSRLTSLDYEFLGPLAKAMDMARHLALPLAVSSIGGIAGITRYMRSTMSHTMEQPFMTALKAKGIPYRAMIYGHGLRNAMLPVITIIGLSIPGLLGGSVIFESIFALPGIGRLFYEGVMTRDYPLLMAEVVFTAVLTMAGNLIADIGIALADPRIRIKQ